MLTSLISLLLTTLLLLVPVTSYHQPVTAFLRRSFLEQGGATLLTTFLVSPPQQSKPLDISSPESVVDLFRHHPETILLDARTNDEIVTNGYVQITQADKEVKWAHASCTLDEGCPLLKIAASSIIPDKNTPVVAYCSSGKRAAKAVAELKKQGYSTVLNAGAIVDLGYLRGLKLE